MQPHNIIPYTPNSTRHVVYTTIHHVYTPTVNYTTLTVELTLTYVTATSNVTTTENSVEIAPTKTPEQLQTEAENSGWLSTWHEFTWVVPMVQTASGFGG